MMRSREVLQARVLELEGAMCVARTQIANAAQVAGPPAASPGQAFPVGSVFISVVATNPAALLGYGTWAAFGAGRVMVGQDASDSDFNTAQETGGAKTVASAGANSAPAFTGSPLAGHTHGSGTLAASAHAGAAVAAHATHTHAYTQVLSHTHTVAVTDPGHTHTQNAHSHTQAVNSLATGALSGYTADTTTAGSATSGFSTGTATATNIANTTGITASTANPAGAVASGTTDIPSAQLTHAVTQPSDHTLSGSTDSVSAGTPAGSVSAPAFTGSQTSVVQPYIVAYFWRRTA